MCEISVSSAKSVLPWVALNAVTETGSSASVDLDGVSNEFTIFASWTGSPTAVSARLQGSHDGVTWFDIPNTSVSEATPGGPLRSTTVGGGSANSNSPFIVPMPYARYVRAYLSTLTGGSSPTVTVTAAVGKVI